MTSELRGEIRLERDGPVARIVLDRPAKRNALNTHMLTELRRRLDDAAADADVRVVTIESEGPVFCAGADTSEFSTTTPELILGPWTRLGQRVFAELAELPQTTIAVLSGSAFGGGLELAMHCDFRVAARGVQVALPEATLGTAPGWSGVERVAGIAGLSAARMLALTGRRYSADDAHELGIIDIVADDVVEATAELVADILRTTPVAQAVLKRALSSTVVSAELIDSLAGAYLAASGETTPTRRTQ
ncbi:enoyl-CoA hydratase/isomerase family protein [Mycolicibacterium sp.]|uniref:enoyl-CoA hydratase/isomerase family protein n=1 Tax=Mycolicibacterium sp. TaxID=2320850 RepID=UPI00095C34FF|nr:3-hydroxybutyryl-CoA dehydratase [Mycobacterium sp. SWH-M3]